MRLSRLEECVNTVLFQRNLSPKKGVTTIQHVWLCLVERKKAASRKKTIAPFSLSSAKSGSENAEASLLPFSTMTCSKSGPLGFWPPHRSNFPHALCQEMFEPALCASHDVWKKILPTISSCHHWSRPGHRIAQANSYRRSHHSAFGDCILKIRHIWFRFLWLSTWYLSVL